MPNSPLTITHNQILPIFFTSFMRFRQGASAVGPGLKNLRFTNHAYTNELRISTYFSNCRRIECLCAIHAQLMCGTSLSFRFQADIQCTDITYDIQRRLYSSLRGMLILRYSSVKISPITLKFPHVSQVHRLCPRMSQDFQYCE